MAFLSYFIIGAGATAGMQAVSISSVPQVEGGDEGVEDVDEKDPLWKVCHTPVEHYDHVLCTFAEH